MAPKRLLGNVDEPADTDLPEGKRPRIPSLASVILETMKMNRFCAALEPLLRKVVTEEIDKALERHVPVRLRSSTNRIQGSESRNMRLQFQNKLSLPLFTGGRVEGEQGGPIHIVLLDASTGEVIKSGLESSLKVEIIVLEGDFGPDEEEDWTMEDFDNHVVREREGKRPLLTGDLVITLKDGIGTLGELTFTDNSSWIRTRKFRLGARVAGGANDGIRIREAMTEAFTVKDHRGELYKKHYPPALHDEVWRLEKIGKDGVFHKRLNNEGINTVEDFLRLVFMDPQRLRQILGNGMSNKMWEGTVFHAKTCGLNNKHFVYYADAQHNIGVVFNTICEFKGLIAGGRSIPVHQLTETQKHDIEKLVQRAYQHWDRVIEYDEGFQFGCASRTLSACIEVPDDSQGPRGSIFQMTDLRQEQDGQGAQPGDKSQMMVGRFVNHNQSIEQVNSDWLHAGDSLNIATSNQVVIGTGFAQQSIIAQTLESSSLALGPRQVQMVSLAPSYQTQNLNSHMHRRNSFRSEYEEKGIRNLYGEHNIARDDWNREPHEAMEGLYCTRSKGELPSELENRGLDVEDFQVQMQNWCRIFNTGTGEQAYNFFPDTQMDHGFTFTGFPPTSDVNFNMSQARLHGKAYMGWLKLKAALKWGICIRKVVAAKRAKLEEAEH